MGERLVGPRKCNKNRCKNVIGTETFQSFVDKSIKSFTKLIIDFYVVTSLVYLLSCKVCGMQYNGQTNDEFRYRWNDCKDNNRQRLRGEDHKQAGFFAHLQTADHSAFINIAEIIFINETDPSAPTRCDDFWLDILKTCYLQSLNNIDPYHELLFSQFY